MFDFLKGGTCLVVVSVLSGCGALDPVNMLSAAMAPSYDAVVNQTLSEMRFNALTSFRTADCSTLSKMLPFYQDDLTKETAKSDRAGIAVAEMNISAVKQIQGEKSCPAATPLQAKNPPSASPSAVAQSSALKTGQGSLNITVDNVPSSFAKSPSMADLKGVLVVEAKKGSAADKAGIKPLDVILEVSGQAVLTPAEFDNIVSRMRPGYKAPLRIWRDGKTRNATVVVSKDERPAPDSDTAPSMASPPLAAHGWLRIQYAVNAESLVGDLSPSVATTLGLTQTRGVLTGGALPGGAAQKAGLRSLDVVVSLNGRQIENRKQLTDLLARLPAGTTIKLGIWRNRKLEFAQVTLDPQPLPWTLPPTAGGYCFAWVSADAAKKTGAISYEFVVPAADAINGVNPAIGAQFRTYMAERGLGADFGDAPGNAVCRTTREAIVKVRQEAILTLKQSLTATGKDTLSVYWVPH